MKKPYRHTNKLATTILHAYEFGKKLDITMLPAYARHILENGKTNTEICFF